MHRMPSRESARKPRENIETLNLNSRSRLSSIKLMEETNVSVQTYSFLEVTAVRYDEKPEKDGQRCDDVNDIVTIGTLSIDNEVARRRRAKVKFSRARVLRMCDVVKTSSSLRRLNLGRFSFW